MHALQNYTPEYKEELLSRAERTWRPNQVEAADTGEDKGKLPLGGEDVFSDQSTE
jgi:hypothetical protein